MTLLPRKGGGRRGLCRRWSRLRSIVVHPGHSSITFSLAFQFDDTHAGSHRVDPQGNAETVPVSKNDFYRIGGSLGVERKELPSVFFWRVNPENEAPRRPARGKFPRRRSFDRGAGVDT